MKTVVASAVILLLSFLAFSEMTENFEVFTKEQARRMNISKTWPMLTDTRLLDERGIEHGLREWVINEKKMLIIEFIYTRCLAVCRSLGNEFQQLQEIIKSKKIDDQIALLTISFDPQHDTPEVLGKHAKRLNADAAIWHFATVKYQHQLAAMLQFFGITIIPDEFGGYQHNAALMAINPNGQLFSVADYGTKQQLEILDAWLKTSTQAGR